jgi:hypothetical protein
MKTRKCLAKTPLPLILALLMVVTPLSCAAPPSTPPPASTIIPNPVEEYAKSLGLSEALTDSLKPLGEDGIMGLTEQHLIDELHILPLKIQIDIKTQSILKDITQDGQVTYDEFYRFQDLDQDGVSNKDEISVYETNPLVAEAWNDFDTVTGILNTPEKVLFWSRNNLRFDMNRLKNVGDPKTTFELKRGVCRHYAMFATECLLRTGYNVENLTVTWGNNEGHTVSILKQNDEFWVVMDSSLMSIQGPYRNYDEIANSIIKRLAPSRSILKIFVEDNNKLIERNELGFQVYDP